jgi:hypothetical protein
MSASLTPQPTSRHFASPPRGASRAYTRVRAERVLTRLPVRIALAGVLVSIFMVRGWDLRPQEMPVSEPGFEAREAA